MRLSEALEVDMLSAVGTTTLPDGQEIDEVRGPCIAERGDFFLLTIGRDTYRSWTRPRFVAVGQAPTDKPAEGAYLALVERIEALLIDHADCLTNKDETEAGCCLYGELRDVLAAPPPKEPTR